MFDLRMEVETKERRRFVEKPLKISPIRSNEVPSGRDKDRDSGRNHDRESGRGQVREGGRGHERDSGRRERRREREGEKRTKMEVKEEGNTRSERPSGAGERMEVSYPRNQRWGERNVLSDQQDQNAAGEWCC